MTAVVEYGIRHRGRVIVGPDWACEPGQAAGPGSNVVIDQHLHRHEETTLL